jgi:4-aminobutyrate aminotransferase-like enzyme
MVRDRASKEPAAAETKRTVNAMRERGVLLSRIGKADNILKIRPPMPFSRVNADQLLETLDAVLTDL